MKYLFLILCMLSSGAAQLGQIGDKEVTTSVEVRLIVPNRKGSNNNANFEFHDHIIRQTKVIIRFYDI